MPTYEYACTNPACGHTFAQVQAFTDDTLTVCPVCGGRLRKVFGSVGVVFKGSGFYRTDSRAEAKNGAGKSGDSGKSEGKPAETTSKPESKSESKPAKSEPKTPATSSSSTTPSG